MRVLLAVALLPPFLLMTYVNSLDRGDKESTGLLAKLFCFGILAVIPTIFLEQFLEGVIYDYSASMLMYTALENFIGVALVEEGCKLLFLRLGSWKHWEFNYKFDGIVYAVFVSLGFAAIENVLYVFQYGISTGLFRAVTSIPGHCIFGIFMGYFYSMAKDAEVDGRLSDITPNNRKSLLVPLVLHGFYDFILSFGSSTATIVFFGYILVLDIFAWKFIRAASLEDEAFTARRN